MSEGLFVDYVKTGNVELFDKLEKETRDRVLNTVYRVLGDEGLSQEVTQEVYIKVFKRTMRGKTITNGDGYLIGMARNEAEARLRTELRRIAAEQFSPRHEAYKEQNGYSEEDLKVVRDAVFKLPQPLRWYVELRYFEGLPIKEVARAVHAPERTVYARLHEARRVLKSRLSESCAPLILPILTGQANVLWPTIPVSKGLARQLDQMAMKARLMEAQLKNPGPRARHTKRLRPLAASLALTVLIFCGGGASLRLLGGGRGQPAIAGKPKALLKEQAEKRDESPLVVLGPQRPTEEEKHDPVGGARASEKPPAAEPATPPEAPEKASAPKAEEKRAPASAVIRAVDQRGKLLTQGMLVHEAGGGG